jgi:hypothetical protein
MKSSTFSIVDNISQNLFVFSSWIVLVWTIRLSIVICMRYFFVKRQHFNFLIIVSTFISDASFRKIVKSDIFKQRNLRSFSKKRKKWTKIWEKWSRKKNFWSWREKNARICRKGKLSTKNDNSNFNAHFW